MKRHQEGPGVAADGHFGPARRPRSSRVQEANGIEVDGIGPADAAVHRRHDEFAPKVEASLVTENTPELRLRRGRSGPVAMAAAPLTEQEGVIAHAAHAVTDTASNIGKSIWEHGPQHLLSEGGVSR